MKAAFKIGLLLIWGTATMNLAAAAVQVTVEIAVVERKAEGGVRTVRVSHGDTVLIKVRSDEALEVHVHGYDAKVDVAAGASNSMKIAAEIVGRFPVTAHVAAKGNRKATEPTLLYLEVHPR